MYRSLETPHCHGLFMLRFSTDVGVTTPRDYGESCAILYHIIRHTVILHAECTCKTASAFSPLAHLMSSPYHKYGLVSAEVPALASYVQSH